MKWLLFALLLDMMSTTRGGGYVYGMKISHLHRCAVKGCTSEPRFVVLKVGLNDAEGLFCFQDESCPALCLAHKRTDERTTRLEDRAAELEAYANRSRVEAGTLPRLQVIDSTDLMKMKFPDYGPRYNNPFGGRTEYLWIPRCRAVRK